MATETVVSLPSRLPLCPISVSEKEELGLAVDVDPDEVGFSVGEAVAEAGRPRPSVAARRTLPWTGRAGRDRTLALL
jgi:hypothetical protein